MTANKRPIVKAPYRRKAHAAAERARRKFRAKHQAAI